jgi:hypothetical protein
MLLGGTTEECDDREHQEDHEQDLRDTRRGTGDTAKTEYRGNDGNNQENQSVMQHGGVLTGNGATGKRVAGTLSFTHTRRLAGVKAAG